MDCHAVLSGLQQINLVHHRDLRFMTNFIHISVDGALCSEPGAVYLDLEGSIVSVSTKLLHVSSLV